MTAWDKIFREIGIIAVICLLGWLQFSCGIGGGYGRYNADMYELFEDG